MPGDTNVVVRDLVLDNTSASASQVILYGSSGGVGFTLLRASLPANSSSHYELRQAMLPGDTLQLVNQGAAGSVGVLVTAYVFD